MNDTGLDSNGQTATVLSEFVRLSEKQSVHTEPAAVLTDFSSYDFETTNPPATVSPRQ